MKCQKIHFEKAYTLQQATLLSMLKEFGIFAIYPVRRGTFLMRFILHITPFKPKIDASSPVVHHAGDVW